MGRTHWGVDGFTSSSYSSSDKVETAWTWRSVMQEVGGREPCDRVEFSGGGGPSHRQIDRRALCKTGTIMLWTEKACRTVGWHQLDLSVIFLLLCLVVQSGKKGEPFNYSQWFAHRRAKQETTKWRRHCKTLTLFLSNQVDLSSCIMHTIYALFISTYPRIQSCCVAGECLDPNPSL